MSGLSLLSRDLDNELKSASSEKQRKATLAACEFAIAKADIKLPVVDAALQELRNGKRFPPDLRVALDTLTQQFDEKYFTLKEAAESGTASKDDYQVMFAKARAIAALSSAGGDGAFNSSGEAIYEAAFTIGSDDKAELFSLVESVLRKT